MLMSNSLLSCYLIFFIALPRISVSDTSPVTVLGKKPPASTPRPPSTPQPSTPRPPSTPSPSRPPSTPPPSTTSTLRPSSQPPTNSSSTVKQIGRDGHEYTLFIEPEMTWGESVDACNKADLVLAPILTSEDLALVQQLVHSGGSPKVVWIGGTKENRNKWEWIEQNQPVQSFVWNTGEPNDVGNIEKCMALYDDAFLKERRSNDLTCSQKHRRLCRTKIAPTPPPTSTSTSTSTLPPSPPTPIPTKTQGADTVKVVGPDGLEYILIKPKVLPSMNKTIYTS